MKHILSLSLGSSRNSSSEIIRFGDGQVRHVLNPSSACFITWLYSSCPANFTEAISLPSTGENIAKGSAWVLLVHVFPVLLDSLISCIPRF